MRQVHRVSSLKCNHAAPATFFDFAANFYRGSESIGKIGGEITVIQNLDGATDRDSSLGVKGRHTRMPSVVSGIYLFSH